MSSLRRLSIAAGVVAVAGGPAILLLLGLALAGLAHFLGGAS